MANLINITPDYIKELTEKFVEYLGKGKFPNGKIDFSETLGKIDKRATVYYTEEAWAKQKALVDNYSSEIAWHGIVKKIDNPDVEENEYVIKDILVYPQKVSGVTVNTDEEKLMEWMMKIDAEDEERFNAMKMQGHSHVNMSTSPSNVDLETYRDFLVKLKKDQFYIFMIWNKKYEKTVKIYDLKDNIYFETKDVDVVILENDDELDKFSAFNEEEATYLNQCLVDYRMSLMINPFLEEVKKVITKEEYKSKYSSYGTTGYNGRQATEQYTNITTFTTSDSKKSKKKKNKDDKKGKSFDILEDKDDDDDDEDYYNYLKNAYGSGWNDPYYYN